MSTRPYSLRILFEIRANRSCARNNLNFQLNDERNTTRSSFDANARFNFHSLKTQRMNEMNAQHESKKKIVVQMALTNNLRPAVTANHI